MPNYSSLFNLGATPVRSASAQLKPAPQQVLAAQSQKAITPIGPPGPPPGYQIKTTPPSGGGGTFSQTQSTVAAPATSGQAADSGGGNGFDYIQSLRDIFGQQRSSLESILPTYDSDLSNFTNTVNNGITQAKQTLADQNSQDERTYGQSLKQLLQNDSELRQRRQGTFSALGALDSSAFRDETTKSDQFLQDQQGNLTQQKNQAYGQRQRDYAAYENEANSKITAYTNEINRAKEGLRQAIANVNLDEASNIQNYISQLQNEASQVDAQRQAMALNLAQLQAQGTDVIGNLKKVNLNDFANTFGKLLSNNYSSALGRYGGAGQPVSSGSGYIGSGLSDDLKRQLGLA